MLISIGSDCLMLNNNFIIDNVSLNFVFMILRISLIFSNTGFHIANGVIDTLNFDIEI